MSIPALILNVHGGVVQDAFSDLRGLEITVVDWDVDTAHAGHPDVVSIVDRLGRDQHVCVAPLTVRPFSELVGTDVDAALQAVDFVGSGR
jgi:hypothetical protein